ncbi:hypothetical protein DHEL01_v209927 [Diaporthe helianthi]|uniref:Fucose-specific lectin n=1 Tax=Diaporthe helianthi TaxID=158607 RepID=A0A2P5HN48_DIAHE|nr:hypothetical protein DHEL01_v209927 [Diaporthe helianthi]
MSGGNGEDGRRDSIPVSPTNDNARGPVNVSRHLQDEGTGEKEYFNPVELDSPTVPRGRHYSETSFPIHPQVISSNITKAGSTSLDTTDKSVAEAEVAVAPVARHSGFLVPRWVGTSWKRMSKTVRNVLVIIIIFAIIIVVATVLGVLLGRRHDGKREPAEGQYDILDTSKLAAVAFQNVGDITDKSVFFQDSGSLAIMRARWNDSSVGWKFENVSQSMTDGGSSIFPRAGTPLTAVAADAVDTNDLPRFWVDLYFMSLSNVPYQIWTWSTPQTDPSKDLLWHQEGLQTYQVIFNTGFAKGTQLAAYRDSCAADMCSQDSRLLYQGRNNDLMLASSPVQNWMIWNVTNLSVDDVPQLPQLEMNSSLAVTRFSPGPGPGAEPSGMRMYYDVSHQLEEYMFVNGTWTNGSFEASLGDQVTPPDVAVVAYANDTDSGGRGLDHTLITILFQNGSVVVHWQESLDGPWQMGLAPEEVNATALALDYDLRAYSLSPGKIIQEWQIDRFDPTMWSLVSNVTRT